MDAEKTVNGAGESSPAPDGSVSDMLHTVRRGCHDLADRLEANGVVWAAVELRAHVTPRLWEIAQKHCKPNKEIT